jgi:hypothetical protein
MTAENNVCYYGLRFGCGNTTNDPNCNKCAERIANAVVSMFDWDIRAVF